MMRLSDALGLISQEWRVPISELMSYHRVLRAANMIEAQPAGRGRSDVSEDTILRFVLAFCVSRYAAHSAERLALALEMRRPKTRLPWIPNEAESTAPAFFLQDRLFDTLKHAVRHFAASPNPDRLPTLSFKFENYEAYAEMLYSNSWFPGMKLTRKSQDIVFLNFKDTDARDTLVFQQQKTFHTSTIKMLANIIKTAG
jgi:hypothetical protein